jgi:hypothetical protein
MSEIVYQDVIGEHTLSVKEGSEILKIPCYEEGCKCYTERVIQVSIPDFSGRYPVSREDFCSRRDSGQHYNVLVPDCVAHISQSPISAAAKAVEEKTGYIIINLSETKNIVKKNSNATLGDFDSTVPPIIPAAFGNNYYLQREVFEFCIWNSSKKCKWCNKRHCGDWNCEREIWDLKDVSNRYGESFVYFLYHAAVGQVKIGYSDQPEKRIQAHRASNAGEIQCLGVVYGSKRLEGNIHDELKIWRTSGKREWFYYTDHVEKYINIILSCVKNYDTGNKK